MMKKTALWKQAAISALLILGAVFAWQYRADLSGLWMSGASELPRNAARSPDAEGTPVIVAEVAKVNDDLFFSAIGTGFALRSITLRAPSSGEIKDLKIAAGRKFSAGDTLMRLEDTDERLAAALAEARLGRATSERDRYRALQDTGVAATTRLEQVMTDFEVARIELEQARADLANRVLRAPFNGVAGLAAVEVGDRVVADDAISSFDDRSRILVEFDLPEALLSRVAPGVRVLATTPAVEGRRFEGEITAIDSRVDAGSRTARLRAEIDNSDDVLRPGASFWLELELPGKSYPAVPELALQFTRGALYVWRITDGKAEQVELHLVRRRGGQVIVDGPISKNDLIVVEGTQRLRPGVTVNVLNMQGSGNT